MYRSPNIIGMIQSRRMRWAGHVVRMEEGRSSFKTLTGKRPLGKPRRRRKDNIRIRLREIGTNTRSGVIRLRIGITGESL